MFKGIAGSWKMQPVPASKVSDEICAVAAGLHAAGGGVDQKV